MWQKISSSFVGQPKYSNDGGYPVVKYDWVSSKGELINSRTICEETIPFGGAPLFQVTYQMNEDNNVATINIDFDHNTLTVGKLYKINIVGEDRGFILRNDGNLEQFKSE